MFSGRRSARSETGVAVETGAAVDGGLAAGAPFPASASVKTGVEVSSGKIGKPRVSNLRQCCRFFQRKVRAGLAVRSNNRCSGGRVARDFVGPAADTAAATAG